MQLHTSLSGPVLHPCLNCTDQQTQALYPQLRTDSSCSRWRRTPTVSTNSWWCNSSFIKSSHRRRHKGFWDTISGDGHCVSLKRGTGQTVPLVDFLESSPDSSVRQRGVSPRGAGTPVSEPLTQTVTDPKQHAGPQWPGDLWIDLQWTQRAGRVGQNQCTICNTEDL